MNQDTSSDMRSGQPDTTDRQATEARSQALVTTRPLPSDALIIVPVRNVVLFPGMVLPLTVGSERARSAVQEAVRLQRPLGVLLQSKADVDEPVPEDLHWVGTTANVLRYVTATEGVHHIICKGLRRFRVLQFLEGYPFAVRASTTSTTRKASTRTSRAARCSQAACPRGPPAAAAGARGVGGRSAGRREPGATRRLHRRPDGHRRRGEAGAARDLRSQGAARQAAAAVGAPHRGAEGLARHRSAHARVDRRRTASTCCASRCARSRRSWAKTTKAPRRSPSSTRRSPRRRCRRTWRSRRARS